VTRFFGGGHRAMALPCINRLKQGSPQHAAQTQRGGRFPALPAQKQPSASDGDIRCLSRELDMTVANSAVPSSSSVRTRRARLEAAAHPVLAGPSTSAVAIGAASAGDVACVTLANTHLRLDVAPRLGGGVTRFDWRSDGNLVPVFRRCRHVNAQTDANELACYALLPYSNRIGGGCFNVGGRTVEVPCNRAGEALPLHGDGWLAAWQVADTDQHSVRLTLDHSHGKPYAFRATQIYALDGPTLAMTLEVENVGREMLPFGLGVHPFLVRDADTQLAAAASGLWLARVAVRRGVSAAADHGQSRLHRVERTRDDRVAEAAAVADGVVEYRLLRAVHAAGQGLLLFRAGRSSDQRDEPAGRGG
jgi:hypothetical protein